MWKADTWYSSLKEGHRQIMGVLNVTPDSFSDGGKFADVDSALRQAEQLILDGADILDVGGESTKPGAEIVSESEELRRVIPIVSEIAKRWDIPISIDTYKSAVADRALDSGANVINDISGATFDSRMFEIAAKHKSPLVLMHILGTPKDMQKNPHYNNVVDEVKLFLSAQCRKAKDHGIPYLIVDPGFGFGKRYEDNFTLLRNLASLRELGFPILAGTSRKSFLGAKNAAPPEDRLEGTLVTSLWAVQNGASIVRAHDVRALKRALLILEEIERS